MKTFLDIVKHITKGEPVAWLVTSDQGTSEHESADEAKKMKKYLKDHGIDSKVNEIYKKNYRK